MEFRRRTGIVRGGRGLVLLLAFAAPLLLGTSKKPTVGVPSPASPAGAVVRGRLVDLGSGGAIAGRLFVLAAEDDEELSRRRIEGRWRLPVLAEHSSGRDGRFELRLPSREGFFRIEAEAPGRARTLVVEEVDGARRELALPPVRLAAGGALSGKVTAPDGAPVAGAVVSFRPAPGLGPFAAGGRLAPIETESAADGSFRLEGVGDDGGTLVVRAAGFATLRRKGARPGGGLALRLAAGNVVEGSVVDDKGRTPIEGASVEVDDDPDGPLVLSDREGRFRIGDLPAGTLSLVASDHSHRAESWKGTIPLAEGAPLPALRLLSGGALRVVATSRSGNRPIARATLLLSGPGPLAGPVRRVRTDARGEATIDGLAPLPQELTLSAAGYLEARLSGLVVRPGEKRRLPVSLQAAASLSGVAVDEKGEPLAEVRLEAREERIPGGRRFLGRLAFAGAVGNSAETDVAGRFRIEGLAPERFELSATRSDLPPAELALPRLAPGEERGGVRIVLPAGGFASGRVVDESGAPLDRVDVTASAGDRGMPIPIPGLVEPLARSATGADGSFLLRALPAGTVRIRAHRSGFVADDSSRVTVVPGRTTETPDIVLLPGASLAGRVVDRRGDPVPLARLMVGEAPFGFGGEATTDGAGSFRIDDLDPKKSYQVMVTAEGWGRLQKSGLVPGGEPVELVLLADAHVVGRVVVKGGAEPVTAFTVQWRRGAVGGGRGPGPGMRSGGAVVPVQSVDGVFDLGGVEPGSVDLVVRAAGFREAVVAGVEVKEGSTGANAQPVVVELERGLRLSGRVLDSGRGPLADASVSVQPDDGRGGRGRFPFGGGYDALASNTDADGAFVIEGVAPGTVSLLASASGRPSQTKVVELAADRSDVEIVLANGATVTGEVRRHDGSPAAGAEVAMQEAGSGMRGGFGGTTETADAAGRFVFRGVEKGRYDLLATTTSGGSSAKIAVTVADGDPAPVVLEIRGGVRVDLTVSGLPGDQLRKVSVTAMVSTGPLESAPLGDGHFVFEEVPPGDLHLSAGIGEGFLGRRVSKEVTVVDETPLSVEIVFPPGSSLSGRVTKGGEPVGGALAVAFPTGDAGQTSASATTSSDGRYSIAGLEEGAYHLAVTLPGSSARWMGEIEIRGDTTRDVELPSSRLAGRIVDSGRRTGIAGARVLLRPTEGGGFAGGNAESSSDGSFVVADLADGEYRLTVTASGYSSAERGVTMVNGAAGGEVEVALDPEALLTLRAVDRATGAPASRALVAEVQGGRVVRIVEARGEGGLLRVSGLAPGTASLVVEVGGAAPVTLPVVPVPGELTVTTSVGGTVEVVVPKGRAAVRLLRADGAVEWLRSEWGGPRAEAIVSAPRSILGPIAPGAYHLVATIDGADRLFAVSVADGAVSSVTLE